MSQRRLPGIDPPDQIRVNEDRKAPAFWVRRVRVLRELAEGDEHIIRDVELRRGLNIIWAPPHESSGENALFQNGVAGHTAGKSTFCRLVRYVLGERGYAPERTRRRIREELRSAWVVADVVVEDETWIVARPFGIGAHSFGIRGGTIEKITDGSDRLDYQEFLEAIGKVTAGRLMAALFPSTDESVRWEHVLPWISRDQECRFADFLEWRHSSSDSEAPFLSVEERQFVVRSVLGLISDAERLEQQTNAHLVSQKKDATQKEPFFSYQARTDHLRVSNALGMDLPLPSDPLFGYQARNEVNRRTAELRQREQDLSKEDQRADLRKLLDEAIAAATNALRDLKESESRLQWEQTTLSQLLGDSQSDLLAALPPPTGFCSVPMSVARNERCPLAVSRPTDLSSRQSERTAAEELADQRRIVQTLEDGATDRRKAFAAAEAATKSARRAYVNASTAFDDQRGKLLQEKAQLSQITRLVEDAEKAWQRAGEQSDVLSRIDCDINESYARQEQLRAETREALRRFSERFDYVVRAILGDEVSGNVDTAGRSLSLSVEEHGERESAAIATVKLLAFDLAALTTSAEGHGNFPRFLIHDGPREADMSPDIYERLFMFAHELERSFSGEPSFQYIVTTTTPPPAAFQNEPWLRLKLSGIPKEERLLRCDL